MTVSRTSRGPDGFQLASRMCGVRDPDAQWEIAIHALPPLIDRFPRELYFDRDRSGQ